MNREIDRPCMGADPLFAELEAVVADPVFNRSPAQVRMLRYLVEASAAGEGASLKSYTLAVEGLGRSEDFDSQTNTYSRVLAARLRRSLDAFYRGPGKDRSQRLEIPQGTYEVQLRPNRDEPSAAPPNGLHALSFRASKRLILGAAATIAALVLAGLVYLYLDRRADAVRWRTPNFPLISIQTTPSVSPANAERMAEFERVIVDAVSQYDSVRVANRTEATTDYVLNLTPVEQDGSEIQVELVDNLRNRRLYVATVAVSGGEGLAPGARLDLERTVFGLFGYAGIVTSLESRFSASADTPFDCWLRFSNSVVADGAAMDPELKECAKDWYENAPSHHLAGAIHAWTLATSTLGDPPGSRRDQRLDEALRIAERARALDPGSRLAALSLARIYGFIGDADALKRIGRDIAATGDLNPDVYGAIGALLVFQNDLSGEAEVDRAIAFHPAPPPRYFIAKYIAAMMRDDPEGAGKALERIMTGGSSSNWSLYFQTAYLALVGRIDEARRVWAAGTANRPLLRLFPRYFLRNAPAAPEVKQRLEQWLAPAIDG